jgi:hypothetical protein
VRSLVFPVPDSSDKISVVLPSEGVAMKTLSGIMITTHVDLDNERMAVEGLESFAATVNNNYLPFTREHDIRKVPIGRVVSATVVRLDNGEFAVKGTMDIFEESDTLSTVCGDGRRIRNETENFSTFNVGYDRSFETPEGRQLLATLALLSPESGSTAQVKKSVEHVSVLTIMVTTGAALVAKGFLGKLGQDAYAGLKKILVDYFTSRKRSQEHVLDFQFTTSLNGQTVEVHVVLTNPTQEELEMLFASGFVDVDTFLANCQGKDLARFVFEYKEGRLECLYILRGDCVPLQVRRVSRKPTATR